MQTIKPQQGPQEAFLSTPADIAIYGGAAGGGKSFSLLMDPLRWVEKVDNFSCVIFRKTTKDIRNVGGIWDESFNVYGPAGATPNQTALTWKWETNATIQFSHFEHPKYKSSWQGAQIALIAWDELTHFSQDVFFYMLSRNRSVCGVKPYVRATCNPDPDSWVREFIAWWIDPDTGYPIPERDGEIRWFVRLNGVITWYDKKDDVPTKLKKNAKSVTFISAKLTDNPILCKKDPGYLSNLLALPAHEKEALLGGNWNARARAGDYFKREWFEYVTAAPSGGVCVRYWDRAATIPSDKNPDPDWTVGVKLRKVAGIYYVEDVVRFRDKPAGVRNAIRNTAAADNMVGHCAVVLAEDPGQAGKTDIEILTKYLSKYDVHAVPETKAKEVRARNVSAQSQAGNVKLVMGPWNKAFVDELESVFGDGHDDQADALSGGYNYIELETDGGSVRFLDL